MTEKYTPIISLHASFKFCNNFRDITRISHARLCQRMIDFIHQSRQIKNTRGSDRRMFFTWRDHWGLNPGHPA